MQILCFRQLRHFRFPVAMAICLDPFCLIMERFYHTTLSFYLRDPNMDMEKDLECHLMRIIRIILDVAQALSHLHRKNWIHCHVSSQSILGWLPVAKNSDYSIVVEIVIILVSTCPI